MIICGVWVLFIVVNIFLVFSCVYIIGVVVIVVNIVVIFVNVYILELGNFFLFWIVYIIIIFRGVDIFGWIWIFVSMKEINSVSVS